MNLIDGKATAKQIKMEIATEVAAMIDAGHEGPHLAAVIVGDDPASHTYVNGKEKACQEVGMTSSIYRLPEDTSEKEVLEIVDFLNNDDHVDGFIVQLPLPKHIDENKVIMSIKPEKDVDGFHPVNVGRMALGLPAYISATPFGIMELIKRYNIETEGKRVVVLGRSNIVGSPMSILLSRKAYPGNATVTLCHSRTKNLKQIAKSADILIVAMGQPHFVNEEMVKKNAVVIDVGIHRVASDQTKSGFRLIGDVDFDRVISKASYITPVPGGVGPMTIVSLLLNTLKAHKKEIYS
ncbi:MAG TPA: bifunctional methylenetetrahydrofolate dehydrogenase/methenyltetrahydrofolate cyclohydrolase FolD [Bacteroidales bacterium]|nr:bifunctional methylenetetrahydrofolate dehydrogenase/methenyltetrahydrofolate cyclohydrolase FolD [Bacteroidales bacterium]HPE56996.1 bifunctional methylenetetrahydrofolate dehydrogenase/methenyltetrahydrofolate cyclohydrolase FolD [Bacteroidales bacterium]HRX96042.1 bifunctional methylenetetrahydrofolate dehydrogenase/methenyltetrahydrofolate cyclohydrolase FolD [Bacteroidales bacterium]